MEMPMGWGSSSGTQVSGSAPAGGIGYASLQGRQVYMCHWKLAEHECGQTDCTQKPAAINKNRIPAPVDELCVWCDSTQSPPIALAGGHGQAQDVQVQHTTHGHQVGCAFLQVLV